MFIIILIYYNHLNTYNFFKKKGVRYLEPQFLIGNLGPRLMLKTTIHEFNRDIYNKFKGYPYGGIFDGTRPVLMVLDPDLIKYILIRDSSHFTDRLTLPSKEPDYIKRSLLNLKGQEWKSVRSILTPTFSSARLKAMMPLIQYCSSQLVELLRDKENEDVEMKHVLGHFTLEVIGACGFGIKYDVLSKNNSNFLKVAEKFNYLPIWKRTLFVFILITMPKVMRFINFSFFNPETAEELIKILRSNKEERRTAKTKTCDFLQLMIDASESERKEKNVNDKIYLDDATIDAQSLLFLLAGYETSSTLLSFAVHVLATKPDIQDKLRAHINEHVEGNEITYEVLSKMTYLEYFLLETLRIYPPLARIDRQCTKKYTMPGTNVTINVDDVIAISVYGIHMDPDIYPEPGEFRPERFSEDEKKDRPAHMYLAFGGGPRNCIGLRFALTSSKIALISLVRNFKFTRCSKTMDPVKFNKKSLLLKPESGLWVHVEAIRD